MTAYWLNIAGLIFGIVGVVILFFWGPPQPMFPDEPPMSRSPVRVTADGKIELIPELAKMRAKKRRHEIGSRVGLVLVLIGFGLQLGAAVLQRPKSAAAAAATAFHVDGAC